MWLVSLSNDVAGLSNSLPARQKIQRDQPFDIIQPGCWYLVGIRATGR